MEFTIYKPTKSGKGGAFKFNLHREGKFSFLKGARQIGKIGSEKVFGWDSDGCVNAKMSADDLASLLTVIMRFDDSVSLYHQTVKGNKIIEFKHVPDRKGYSLKVSEQTKDGQMSNVFIGITYAEAIKLKVYCECVIAENLRQNANRQD